MYVWDFPLLTFKWSLRCLFSPHHVNQGGVQKATPQVTLYKPHTAEESLRRRRAVRHSQVLPDHAGQAWELWLCVIPHPGPHPGSSWPFCLLQPLPHSLSQTEGLFNIQKMHFLKFFSRRVQLPNKKNKLTNIPSRKKNAVGTDLLRDASGLLGKEA